MPAPAPSAPELSVSESPVNQTADDNIEPELDETKVRKTAEESGCT